MSKNELRTYTETNLTGDVHVYKAPEAEVKCGATTCRSIKVIDGEWLVYNQEKFQGTTAILRTDIYPDEHSIRGKVVHGVWNNEVRSLRPVPQNGITLYDMNFYCGHQESFINSAGNLNRAECRSIIVRDGVWELFPYGSYQPVGKPTATLKPGEYDASMLAPDVGIIPVGSIKKIG